MPKTDTGTARKRRQRGSIHAEDILTGAFQVARRTSLDQLSMPVLAEYLGIGVTSIYWYFRKKEDLLNAMTEAAVEKFCASLPQVSKDESWQHVLSAHFRAEREIHREDEVLSDLLLIRTSTYSRSATHRVMKVVESVVAKLIDEGFTPDDALLVYNTISVYTRGSIIHDRILRLANAPTLDSARQHRITDWSKLPVLGSLIDRHTLAGTSDEDFEFALSRLISGFEALDRPGRRAAHASTPTQHAREMNGG